MFYITIDNIDDVGHLIDTSAGSISRIVFAGYQLKIEILDYVDFFVTRYYGRTLMSFVAEL